jgi:hypothetical protein
MIIIAAGVGEGFYLLADAFGPLSLTAVGVAMIFAGAALQITDFGQRWPWSPRP